MVNGPRYVAATVAEGSAMSIHIMSAVWKMDLPDSEKLIMLALADWSNDDGQCWPSIAKLAAKSSKSERTVQGALKSLEAKGALSRVMKSGKGTIYTLHPREDCTPAAAAPPQRTTRTPAAAAPNTLRNTKTLTDASHPSEMRARPNASRLPPDWAPQPLPLASIAHDAVSAWQPGRIERELSKFRDHWAAASGSTARKNDWQAAWRNWLVKADEWTPRHEPRYDSFRGTRTDPALQILAEARARMDPGNAIAGSDRSGERDILALPAV
jgi:predicted transcriptional regulator